LRQRYEEISAKGAEVVAIGTGDAEYAARFVADEHVLFPVLVDDDAAAARAASIRKASPIGLFSPKSFPGARRARKAGHRIHKSGTRVTQLGATFVVGPGAVVHYRHLDAHTADHAPIDEVLSAIPAVPIT
jgi:peroxiredoxin